MKYQITRLTLGGGSQSISSSLEEFNKAKESRKFLVHGLRIENKFELLLENYIEFESELLDISTRNMVRQVPNYEWLKDQTNLINRRIVNLLSTCRLYQDHIAHELSLLFGEKSDEYKTIEDKKSEMYDGYLSYRILETHRNYTQHRNFPIHLFTLHTKLLEDKEKQFRYGLTPKIKIEELKKDNKFKKEVLEEINQKKVLDFKLLIREYISCFGKIHDKLRDVLNDRIKESENYINKILERYKNEFGPEVETAKLSVIVKENRKVIDSVSIELNQVIKRRKGLVTKNGTLTNLHRRYSTSEIIRKS